MSEDVALFLFLAVGAASLFSFVAVVVWSGERRREREAYYRSETIKKLADSSVPGAALEFLRETQRISAAHARGATRLAGLIALSGGIGVMVSLRAMNPLDPVYFAGFIPVCVGVALLTYAQFLAPRP